MRSANVFGLRSDRGKIVERNGRSAVMNPKRHLDLRRHFRQLARDVLPIFLLIALVLAVVLVLFFSNRESTGGRGPISLGGPIDEDGDGVADLPRISLLAAGNEKEMSDLDLEEPAPFDSAFLLVRPIDQVRAPRVARFDSPMGSEHAALTYNAQPFLISRHLGDDVNGIGGQDSDLGDPVYAVADGHIGYAGWASAGWGNVIAVVHRAPNDGRVVQSFYGHLKTMRVPVGQLVRRGEVLGTVGKGDGRYLAHLHFEMRDFTSLSAGAGYADLAQGRLSGEKFLADHRGAPDDWLSRSPEGLPPLVDDNEASLKAKFRGDGEEGASAGANDKEAVPAPDRKTKAEKEGEGTPPSDAEAVADPVAIPRPAP